MIRVGLIGDHDPAVTAHQAIPTALALAAEAAGVTVAHEWVPTEQITTDARVAAYDALWCVPASPYPSTEGALACLCWLAGVAMLYPLCRWFAAVKARRDDWWLSYL